ncbi:50S ribosomal protein L15 [Fonticula alba]|uniref:50S ribosomal protein L15 n=1 Tax=Fonticula alba TaxID=691883 RepID=A0A058Z623_FONAL|nr:50S ribosomal protein L15 [Fonticula alba]KCV69744.1 50S ribosomal protein L15 [Fonticula alba]|eukprot:XP_009496309.1 50S ribosomal protein L15 [Fonticula alba]
MISLSALCRMTASASLRSAGGAPSAAFSSAARQATLAGTISLNNIADNPGSSRAFKRVGRGHGSGLGKTSGRGHKGQNARSGNGKTSPWFEGGQSTIIAKTPKTGFNNAAFRKDFVELNLAQLQHFINIGRINPHEPITIKTLYESGVVHGVKDGVKLLADGRDLFYSKVDIQVSKASALAIDCIESRGGKLTTVYHNKLGLRAHIKPQSFLAKSRPLPRQALPTRRADLEYYRDPARRGYLVPTAATDASSEVD